MTVLMSSAGLALAHALERAKREGRVDDLVVTVYEQKEGMPIVEDPR